MTDFRMQNHVDTGSIVSAYQRKAQIEEEQRQAQLAARDRKVNQVKDVFNQGAGLVDNLVNYSKHKQIKDAQDALANLFAERNTQVPITVPAKSSLFPDLIQAPIVAEDNLTPTTQSYGTTPEYKDQLAAMVARINPEAVTNQIAKSSSFTGEPNRLTTASRSTPMALEMPDGSQTLGYFDPTDKKFYLQDGTEAPVGSKKSYKYDLRPDSEGNLMVTSGASGRTVGGISTKGRTITEEGKGKVTQLNQLPTQTRKEFQSDLSEAKKETVFKEEFKKIQQASRMKSMLEARNFVFDQKIGLQMAKVMGDAGNVAVVEQTEGKESKQVVQKGKQLLETYIKTGKLTEANRKAILEAVDVMDSAAKTNLSEQVSVEEERLSSLYPQLDRKFIRESIIGKGLSERIKPKTEGLPSVGDTFQGGKVISIKRIN